MVEPVRSLTFAPVQLVGQVQPVLHQCVIPVVLTAARVWHQIPVRVQVSIADLGARMPYAAQVAEMVETVPLPGFVLVVLVGTELTVILVSYLR